METIFLMAKEICLSVSPTFSNAAARRGESHLTKSKDKATGTKESCQRDRLFP